MYSMTSCILIEEYNETTSKLAIVVFVVTGISLTLSIKSFVKKIAKSDTWNIDNEHYLFK